MARPVETQMTISCLQCARWYNLLKPLWNFIAPPLTVQASSAFLEAAHTHANQHEQHAIEVVQRLRLYSENYVEPTPPSQDNRDAATGGDTGIQTGFLDRTRRLDQ